MESHASMCNREEATLKFELTGNLLCQETLDLRPSAHVNQFNFFTYIRKRVFPSVQYLIRPSWDFQAGSKDFHNSMFTCQIYINGDKEIKKAGNVMKNAAI